MKKLFAILALAAMATSSNAQIKGDMNDDGVLSYYQELSVASDGNSTV